jgi:hypothetical protein
MPERHAGFTRAGLSRRSLQAKSDRPDKNDMSARALLNSALRTSSGGFNRVNLRLIYVLELDMNHLLVNCTYSFGDDLFLKFTIRGKADPWLKKIYGWISSTRY